MLFKYVGYDRAGQRQTGVIETESRQAAEDLLLRSNIVVTKINRVFRLPPLHQLLPLLFGVSEKQMIAFTRQFITMLEAGISILRALEVLRSQISHPLLKDTITEMIQFLRTGGLFSQAVERHRKIFPPIYARLARIGEQTGDLAGSLKRAADYLEERANTRKKVKSSLTYPAMVALVSGGSVYILLTFSIPLLGNLFAEFRADLPIYTRLVIALGKFVQAKGGLLFLMAILAAAGIFFARRTEKGAYYFDYIMLRVPIIGPLVRKNDLARICDTLYQLLAAGITLVDAMELTKNSLENKVVRKNLEIIQSDIIAGHSLSHSMGQLPLFPTLVSESVKVAEESGNLTGQFKTLAYIYREEFNSGMSRIVGMMEPALILGVGSIVAFLGMTVITTVYSILPAIGTGG